MENAKIFLRWNNVPWERIVGGGRKLNTNNFA